AALGAAKAQGADEGEVVRLGGARCEDDLVGLRADQAGDLAARGLDRVLGDRAMAMLRRMRVAEALGEIGQHRIDDPPVGRGRRLVVEIDRLGRRVAPLQLHGHAAGWRRASGRARSAMASQAARKRSMSAAAVAQPRLTRIAEPATSGVAPIARSTCEGLSLPEEQAAPALTATPARSSAITWVSLDSPGRPRQLVLGRRGPAAPNTRASGRPASALRSSRSRHRASRPASSSSPAATTAAAPKAAMPGAFSVPARRLRSCPPPVS